MRSLQDIESRVSQYKGAKLFFLEDLGYIAWQVSTGENIELLFIETSEPGKGHGIELMKRMCMEIKPYNSVFVFRLASNEVAGQFYRKLGFKEQNVSGLYKVDAVLGVVSYETLCKNLLIEPNSGKKE